MFWNFYVYNAAGYGIPVNTIDSECISLYETLFADMHQHSSIWNIFFENIKNTVWCEMSVGIINTYATVLRWRVERFMKCKDDRAFETLVHCERVLNLGGRLLKRYQDALIHTNNLFFFELACAAPDSCRCSMNQYPSIKENMSLQCCSRFHW